MSIYLDNAATSYPKPEAVYRAMDRCVRELGANPGRGSHRMALEAARIVLAARESAAALIGACDSSRIVFTSSATEAINIALFGVLRPGDRVVTSTMEHNAVSRSLRALQERGVVVVKVATDSHGQLDPAALRAACGEPTRLVVLSHCSNVSGTLQPIEEIGPWCRRQGIVLLVDAAQSAGLFALDVAALAIDLLAVPGHKGLYGPPGTGFLYVREGLRLAPLIHGGTGGASHSDFPPEELPERLEAGTLNTPGLAGLRAGIEFVRAQGLEALRSHERLLMEELISGLQGIAGVELYGICDTQWRGGVLSFNLQGRDPAEVGFLLDHEHGVLARVGLHCAPDAHRTLGTFPRGSVRLSPGFFNTLEDIRQAVAAVAAIASHPRN